LLHYLYDERKGTHDLKGICTTLFGAEDWDAPLQVELSKLSAKDRHDYSKVPRDKLYIYAANDGYWQRFITGYYLDILEKKERKLWLYETIIMPLLSALSTAIPRPCW
jgi:hypothetical protein